MTQLALLFYLLAVLLPFERLVVCVRPDGRVGLEVSGEFSSCLDCGRGDEPATEGDGCCSRAEGEAAPAPCRDIVVLQREDEPGVRPQEISAPDAAPLAAVPEIPGGLAPIAALSPDGRVPREPPRPPPFQLALVLRV